MDSPREVVALDESLDCSFLHMAVARRVAERWRADRSAVAMSQAFDALLEPPGLRPINRGNCRRFAAYGKACAEIANSPLRRGSRWLVN